MTLIEALEGSPAPREILAVQTLLDVTYLDFNGQTQLGQLVVHRDLESEVRDIFREILLARFPIHSMIPVVAFAWSDDASMEANNSSAFNYRLKVGKNTLSAHAMGRAIDINPRQNPYIRGDLTLPPGAVYDPGAPGTLLAEDATVRAFESRGWMWGGRWIKLRDYHHFEKPLEG